MIVISISFIAEQQLHCKIIIRSSQNVDAPPGETRSRIFYFDLSPEGTATTTPFSRGVGCGFPSRWRLLEIGVAQYLGHAYPASGIDLKARLNEFPEVEVLDREGNFGWNKLRMT